MFFFFNDTATTEIYTLSLHDALPIYKALDENALLDTDKTTPIVDLDQLFNTLDPKARQSLQRVIQGSAEQYRSEEHTSELQSRQYLVCRLLLEKKKNNKIMFYILYHK